MNYSLFTLAAALTSILFIGGCGTSVKNQPVFKERVEGEFRIFAEWDFESERLGPYSREEIMKDFRPDPVDLVAGTHTFIVMDTINGFKTKVLRILQDADELYSGLQMNIPFDSVFRELYFSYNWKFGRDWNSTAGGKLHGLRGLPRWSGYPCPKEEDGFIVWNQFKRAGKISTYHYDRTSSWCPWGSDDYKFHDIYFFYGVWYAVTQRLVINSFQGDSAIADGINEIWVNGKLLFQEKELILVENPSKGIEALSLQNFYGGDIEEFMPLNSCSGYMDNIKIFLPEKSQTSLLDGLHSWEGQMEFPDPVEDYPVPYDHLLTAEGSISFPGPERLSRPCSDEIYLIDSGEDGPVALILDDFILDSGDYLSFFDGRTRDSPVLRLYEGISQGNGVTVQASGRYLLIRFSTDRTGNENCWNVSF